MNFDPRDMSKSAHNAVKVILGIDLPRASPASMRAVSEVYDRLSGQLTGELVDVMDTTRSRVRRNFGGAASDHYDRSLAAFTSGDKDYIGKAASTSRMLSGELRKAAANVDYMVSMVWVQLAQLIAEIAWAIATAKFTFGASLSWIPVFKAIRSLAIRRLLAWLAFTVPSHQIVSHVFASFGELIQRVQIANGERDEFDKDLQREAHVGAVIEGLISAGISGGLGAYFKNGFTEVFVRNIDDLRALPDPLPTPIKGAPVPDPVPAPIKNDLPLDPVPPPKVDPDAPPTPRPEPDPSPVPSPGPGTLNNDLADVFARQQDEMLVPFHPNSPPGARAWDNTASRTAFRDDMADLFQRTFGGSMGADQARRLGDDYANTLARSWSDPDLGSQLSKTLGDRLPAHLRDHLVDVPQNLFGSLRQSTGGFLQYLKQLGIGAGSGAVEGTLGEGLGNAANGQGFTVTPWSATSGAIMNPGQQITTDSTLVGIDALKGPDGTILAPDLPPPPEPEPTPEADAGSANREVPPTAPSSGSEERTNPSSDPSTDTPAPPETDDRSAPALDPEAASHARPTDTRDPASQDGDDTVSRDVDAATGENAPEPTVERPDTRPEASEARATDPPVSDDTGASRPNTGPAPLSETQERPHPDDAFPESTGSTDGRTSQTPVAASAPPVASGPVAADRGAPGPAPDGGRPERSTGEQGRRSASDPQGSTQTRQEPSVDGRTPPATESGPTPDDVPVSDEGPVPSHGRTPADVRTESGTASADGSSARPSPGGADRPAETAPEPGPAPRPVHETDAPNTETDTSKTSFSFDALLNPTEADHDSSYDTDDEVSDVSSVFDDEDSDTMSVTTDVSDTKAPDTGKEGAESGYVPGKSTDPLGTPDAFAANRTTVFPVLDVGPDVPPPANGDTTALPPAMARAEEALDHLDRLTRHLDDGDLAQARAVGADIQRLLSPRPTDGAPQNPSVQRARHLALGLVFTLSDPTDRRSPIDPRAFSEEKAEDAGALIRGIDRNLRDRDEPVRARLWLPGGRLDTGDVRRVAQAPPPSGENTPATTTSPSVDLTGEDPVPTQSVDSAAHAGPSPSRTADAQASAPISRPGARAAEALDRLPRITRSLMAGDTRRAWALGAEVQRLLVHRADDGSAENPSDRQARQLALAMMYVLSDPSNRKVPLSGEDLPPRRLDDALGLVRGIGRNLQDRDDPIRARLWLPGGRLNTDYVVNAMRDPADRNLPSGASRDTSATADTTPSTESVDTTNASEETASTGDEDTAASSTPNRENALAEEPGPELTVNVMTQDTEDAEGPGEDSTGIRRFPGEVGLLEYGDRLHDPAFNPNTHDALPTRTRRYIQAYTAESWIAEFSRLRPLNEETVQAELDRRRQESQNHPGWRLYEIGNGRWPDLRVLRPRLDAGVLTPEQERVVREVLDSPYPSAAMDGLRARAGSAGRIAETLPDKRGNGYYPDAQDVLDIIERLDQATRHPLPEGVEAVRGVYGFEHLGPGGTRDPASLVGNTYTDPGYMSLSLGDRPGAAGGSPTDLIHFTLPQGTQGLWVGDRSLHPYERELILARDTTYQITSTEPWGRGNLLHARIIPAGHGSDPHTATESSDEVTVMAVTPVEGSVQAPDAGATSLSDPDALAHGMGLTDGSGGPSETAETGGNNTAGGSGGNNGAEGTSTEGDTTIGDAAPTLEEIQLTAQRLATDIADLTPDIRRMEATTRAAAFDRLEQVGSSFGGLVTRASAMAGTVPEAIDITASLASDIATAANDAARLSADAATGARDNIRGVPASLPQDLVGITSLAQARDAADPSVTAADTVRGEADRAAQVAAQVAEAITGVTGTAGDQAQRHAEEARTASDGANRELQRAQEAADEAVTRQESLVDAVEQATSDGVERALATAATAHTNATNAVEAVETARVNAETAAVDAAHARALTETAVADGRHNDTVDHVVQAFEQAATARSNRDAIPQAKTIREAIERVRRALTEAERMAKLSSNGSPARNRLDSNQVTPPSLDPEDRSAAEVDAEAAVNRAERAAQEALSLPIEALNRHTRSLDYTAEAVGDLYTEVAGNHESAETAAQNANSELVRTRVTDDPAVADTARHAASAAADRAEEVAREARDRYDGHSFARFRENYTDDLFAAQEDARTIQRIADGARGRQVVANAAVQAHATVQSALERRVSGQEQRMEHIERVLDQTGQAVLRAEEEAARARRDAQEAHDQARHPREYPGTLPRDESAKTYDLDYLVRSRLIAPDRLYTERVPEVVEYLITAQAPDMPTSLHSDVASQIDSVARTQGMAVFFSSEGFAVTVTDETGSDTRSWTIQVALESATQDGFRHLALSRESGAPLEGTEEERTHATKRGGASSHDPRRGVSARFTASPMLLGDVTGGFAAGPWLTLGGGYTGGRRSGTAGGNVAVSSTLEYMAFGPPEVYLNDLRVRVKVTPPPEAPSEDGSPSAPAESAGTTSPPAAAQRDETAPAPAPTGNRDDGFQSGVIVNGMALVLPGEVAARPDDVPASIDLTATRPGQGAEGGTPARLPDGPIGGLPISVASVTPRGDGASPHSDLGSWIADYLVSDSYAPHREAMGDVMVNLTKESTRAKIREWQATIRKFFDNDSIQEYLAHLDTGPMTVEVTHPVLGDMMLKLSSTPNKFTAKEHTPSFGETFLNHTVEESTALGLSRNSNVTASVGGGLGIVVPLPTGGSIRLNMPHVEYTWGRTLSAQSQTVSASGDHRSLAHHGTSTEKFTAFDVERTMSVELQEEQVAHTFDVRTVELLQGESATNLQRAATGEDAPSGAEADRVPPFTHLRGERVVDFSGTHHHSLTRVPPPEGERAAEGPETPPTTADDDRGVLETLTDRILEGIAREHPGLVLPELSRKRSLYALKPGQENTSFLKRSFRERWGLRRSYNIAHQNTLDVRNAVRDAMNGDNRDRLASADGLRIQLRESALVDPTLMARDRRLVRPDVLTLALKADFSALTHQGTTTAETGVRMGGSTTLGSESGTGSSHALSLSFGSGMMRSAEADAHGLARLLGGVMASLRWSRINRSSATHGVSYKSNNRFVFPGDSDRWEGTVGFTARLYDDTQVLSGRTDNHVNLFESPVEARYSLITPKKTTEVPLRRGADEPSPPELLPAAESRAIIDPRPEDLAAPEPGDVHERRARAAIDNGATIDKVGLTVLGDDAAASANGVVQKTFDTFTDRRPVLDGRKHKLRGFLDTIGGRHFFTNFLSPVSLASDPATFSPSGHRGRVEMGGTWRSPNDMRAAGATIARPERIVGMHAIEAQVAVTGESSSSAGAAKTKTYTAGLSGTGFVGGTSNTLQEDGAASGADRSAAMGPTPMGGPSHNWNFFRRGETLDSGVSSTSGLFLLTNPATVYTFRMGGSISQAWEFKKHRGLNFPGWWSHKYVGWKAWFNDLASGFITARDAEQGGIIDDAVAQADDGTLEPATQRNPTPPANIRVRTGFDGAGEQRRPADPTAAVRRLEERLRDQGLKLTRGGKERLLASLTQRLGNTTGMIPPVSVKVVPSRGTFRRFFPRSKPARVLVELSKTNPRVDYVTSSVFTVESHSWQAKTTKIHSRGKDHSSAVTVPPWQPAPYGDPEGGPGELPDSHPYLLSPAAGVGTARSDSENVSYTEKQSRSIVMESSGPFARITHDTSLTLSLETAGKDPVDAHADSGPVQTFHLASSLEFGAPTSTPATPLDTAPTPPIVTPRGGDSLADAVTTATRALDGFPPASRDAIIMPTAVYGPDVRDAAIHTIAHSLGWKPRTAPGGREDPTPEQLNELRDHHARDTHEARRHIAERLKLDDRYTPIDNTLNPDALKGLFSNTLGHPEGTDILRIGRTQWRVAATPDFTGSRILTARPSSRLAYKETEGQAVSHGHSQSGGTTATVAFRPTGSDTVDSDNPDRSAILTGSGDATVQNNTSSSPAAHSLVTGAPPDMTRQRLGTAYLVEFDTTWTIGSRTTNKTPFGDLPQQFTTDHTNKVSAWISQSDAIRLGIITPEQAHSADTPITAELDAATTMSDAEATYIAERAKLPVLADTYIKAYNAHHAAPTSGTRASLDALIDALDPTPEARATLNTALTAHATNPTNATQAALDTAFTGFDLGALNPTPEARATLNTALTAHTANPTNATQADLQAALGTLRHAGGTAYDSQNAIYQRALRNYNTAVDAWTTAAAATHAHFAALTRPDPEPPTTHNAPLTEQMERSLGLRPKTSPLVEAFRSALNTPPTVSAEDTDHGGVPDPGAGPSRQPAPVSPETGASDDPPVRPENDEDGRSEPPADSNDVHVFMMETDDDAPATEAGEPGLARGEEDALAAALGLDGTDSDDDGMNVDDGSDADTMDIDHDDVGVVGEDGVRRFDSDEQLDSYDHWLQDPDNNPHAFDTLPRDQREMVDTYTRTAWITRMARVQPFVPQNVLRQLTDWRNRSRAEAADPDTAPTAHGWDLYEANNLTWPTLERLREIQASPASLPARTRGLIDYILTARDPAAELGHWYHNAGYAGVIAGHDNGAYPHVERVRELFGLLDGAVDRPLPEGVQVSRGLNSIDHLLREAGSGDPRDLVGTVHTEPGYMSTSLGDDPFKTDADPFPFLLRLDVPEGAHGLWIGSRSHDPEQRELTLARGTDYRITEVRRVDDPATGTQRFELRAEVVPTVSPRPDTFSSGQVGSDGVRRFGNPFEAMWYGHRLHNTTHNPHALNALAPAERSLARALSKFPAASTPVAADPNTSRAWLDAVRGRSRVFGLAPTDPRSGIGWDLYEANNLTWPTLERLGELFPVERERNPGRARLIHFILNDRDPRAALARMYQNAGEAGALAEANGGVYPTAERLRELLDTYDTFLDHPLPDAVETTWLLDDPSVLHSMVGFDPNDPTTLIGTEQATSGYTAVALNPDPIQRSRSLPVAIRLTLPPGTRGLWVGSLGLFPANQEFVLPPGTPYRVTAAHSTNTRLVITAEVIVPPQARPEPGTEVAASPLPAGADTVPTGHSSRQDPPAPAEPSGDGTGFVDDHGVRRLRSDSEIEAYGQWLHDPVNNPNAHDTLDQARQDGVYGYTLDGWVNWVVREGMAPGQIARHLDSMRESTRQDVETEPMDNQGWDLYEANDLTWPTLQRLGELEADARTPDRARRLMRSILGADDPESELEYWYKRSGAAGNMARSSGDVYPTPELVLRQVRILDSAIDRPLPTAVEVVRGLEDLDHLDGFDPNDPYSLVGTVHTESGFMSTSLGGVLPDDTDNEYAHVIRLTLPRGAHGLWIGDRSVFSQERELLLPRGTTYRVTRAGWGGSQDLPGFFIEAEVVVTPGPGSATSSTP